MFWPLASFKHHPPLYIGRDSPLGVLPYAMPEAARQTHMYVIGNSGKGKSKFLESLIVKDVIAGRGLCVIDPHADLANDILANLLSRGYFDDPSILSAKFITNPHAKTMRFHSTCSTCPI